MSLASKLYSEKFPHLLRKNQFEAKIQQIIGPQLCNKDELQKHYSIQIRQDDKTKQQKKNGIIIQQEDEGDLKPQILEQEQQQQIDQMLRNYIVVDQNGQVVQTKKQQSSDTPKESQCQQHNQTQEDKMLQQQRSLNLWKKLNPSCIKENYNYPNSTYVDHYDWNQSSFKFQTVKHNLQKTDFSKYSEACMKEKKHQQKQ